METIIDNVTALYSLGYKGFWGSNKNLNFPEGVTPPTESEIDAEVKRLQAEYDAQEYARNRALDYPDWGAQFNKIYDDGLTKWKTEMVDPVKAKYPKP